MSGPRPGALTPAQHHGEPLAEQRRLAAGEAIVDLGDRDVLTVAGPDRLSWLDSLTSQRLTGLVPGESAETLLLDPSGRVEHALRVLDDGETTWLLLDAGVGAPLLDFLERMRFLLRVEVADRSADFATWGAIGAEVPSVAESHGIPLIWRDPWRAVVTGGHQYAAGEHPAADWDYTESLVERSRIGELDGVARAGTLALEALRIAAWRPREATELDARSIPHELDWLRSAVHLSKGCYRGQETVAKVHNLGHPPRRLVMLHLDGSESVLPAAGAIVRTGDDAQAPEAGRVTAAALHHELGPIALAVIKRSTDPGAVLLVDGPDSGRIAATQQLIVPPTAGATADVPRLPRLGSVPRG
ncbi:MAG: folate-binding protein YgfZ [Microbacteriaceae bacterium]|nr:folate-binding protein YgfZ [Microbacteriaceae bacterium]